MLFICFTSPTHTLHMAFWKKKAGQTTGVTGRGVDEDDEGAAVTTTTMGESTAGTRRTTRCGDAHEGEDENEDEEPNEVE